MEIHGTPMEKTAKAYEGSSANVGASPKLLKRNKPPHLTVQTLSHTEHIRIHNHLKWIWAKPPAITCKITQKSLARHVHTRRRHGFDPSPRLPTLRKLSSRSAYQAAVGNQSPRAWEKSKTGVALMGLVWNSI